MIVFGIRSISELGKKRMRAKPFERRQAKNLYALKRGESQSPRFGLDLSRKFKLSLPRNSGIPMDVGKVKLGNLGKMA